MHLTARLRTIMEQVPQGAHLADIGTDHALIPAALLRRGKISSAIASDIRSGPLESAARTAKQFDLTDKISLRLGAGLEKVSPEEADTIIIAGMGGETIVQILTDDAWGLAGDHLLLLQPMTAKAELRQFLAAHGAVIEKEVLCEEGQRMYTVICARGGGNAVHKSLSSCCISDAMCSDPLAAKYIHKLLTREQKICLALEHAKQQKPEELQLHRENVQVLERALMQIEKS